VGIGMGMGLGIGNPQLFQFGMAICISALSPFKLLKYS